MMETTTTETIEILNDLAGINNDRITGYEKALDESEGEDDLRSLFRKMIDESCHIRLIPAAEVQSPGGEIETGTTTRGKLYRAWMSVKSTFRGNDRHAI